LSEDCCSRSPETGQNNVDGHSLESIVLAYSTVTRFFEQFVPSRLHQPEINVLKNLDARSTPHRPPASNATPPACAFDVCKLTRTARKMDRVRIPSDMDQVKSGTSGAMAVEPRSHNASPSQKTAMPRWRRKGKEKSTIAHACTWVVDHQISTVIKTMTLPYIANALQALRSISSQSSSLPMWSFPVPAITPKSSLVFPTTTRPQARSLLVGTISFSSFTGSSSSRACAAPSWTTSSRQ
jgi:hypothetical protein